jgi:predicted amidophosphoribosyltransferase
MRCVEYLSLLHYSTSGMLCRACGRLEPHNHSKRLYCVKCFAPLDDIEKYDLWCKRCNEHLTHIEVGQRLII